MYLSAILITGVDLDFLTGIRVKKGFFVFKKGDIVVYPHHGAGTIEAIQEKNIFSEKKSYYILKLSVGKLVISVPVDNCQDLGLRNAINKTNASKVLKVLADKKYSKAKDYNERFKINNDKLGTGDVFAIAEVVRDLHSQPNLSTREKRMLSKAKDILVSELKFSFQKSEEEMVKKVNKVLN